MKTYTFFDHVGLAFNFTGCMLWLSTIANQVAFGLNPITNNCIMYVCLAFLFISAAVQYYGTGRMSTTKFKLIIVLILIAIVSIGNVTIRLKGYIQAT